MLFFLVGNAVAILVQFPLGGVNHGFGNFVGHGRIPAHEHVTLAGGGAIEGGGIQAAQQIGIHLVFEGFAAYAVGVGDGIMLFFLVGNAVAILVQFPLGGVNHGFGNFVGHGRIPAHEHVTLAGGGAIEGGGIQAAQQIGIHLVFEGFAAYAVGVGDDKLVFQIIREAVAVLVLAPLGGVGRVTVHGRGHFGIPAGEHVAFTGEVAVECGSSGAVLHLGIDLIGENAAIHAVGVGHRGETSGGDIQILAVPLFFVVIPAGGIHSPTGAILLVIDDSTGRFIRQFVGIGGQILFGIQFVNLRFVRAVLSLESVNVGSKISNGQIIPERAVGVLGQLSQSISAGNQVLYVINGIVPCGLGFFHAQHLRADLGRIRRGGSSVAPHVHQLLAIGQPQAMGLSTGGIQAIGIGIPHQIDGSSSNILACRVGMIVFVFPYLLGRVRAVKQQGLHIGDLCGGGEHAAGVVPLHIAVVLHMSTKPVIGLISVVFWHGGAVELEQLYNGIAAAGNSRLSNPLSGVGGVVGHGRRNFGLPAGEGITFAGGFADESGSGVAFLDGVSLVSENCTVYAVGIGYGVLGCGRHREINMNIIVDVGFKVVRITTVFRLYAPFVIDTVKRQYLVGRPLFRKVIGPIAVQLIGPGIERIEIIASF